MAARRPRADLWRGRHVPCLTRGRLRGLRQNTCPRTDRSGKEADVSFPLSSLKGRRGRGQAATAAQGGGGSCVAGHTAPARCSRTLPAQTGTAGMWPSGGHRAKSGPGAHEPGRRQDSGKQGRGGRRPEHPDGHGTLTVRAPDRPKPITKKACSGSCKPLYSLVPRDRIELPTRGFSVLI